MYSIHNPYEILEINYNSTKEEIKYAYKKMALKYHPDKNNGDKEKFIEIKKAYDALIEKNYDKYIFINNIKKILNIFSNDEKYLYEINNDNYKNAFFHLFKKYSNNICNLNITENIYCDIKDRYNDNYMLVEIIRKTRDNIKIYVPLRNYENIFYNEGEIDQYGNTGNLILYTNITNKNFICNNFDVVMIVKNIDNNNKINYINDIILDTNNIKKSDNYIIYKNFGLPSNNSRGDLIVKIKKK